MTPQTKQAIFDHALNEMPRESCGLVLAVAGKERYFPCRNIAHGTEHFTIHPQDYLKASETGTIIAVAHSHPYIPAAPSMADFVGCEKSGVPWHIVSVPVGIFEYIEPKGYQAPYVGRTWCHGVLDCYTLVRDWYAREMQIDLPDVYRDDEWWSKGQNLYVDHFEKEGFRRIDHLPTTEWKRGDGFLIQHGNTVNNVPNHAAIYLGNGRILHHIYGRLSTESPYGGYWQKHTTHVLRHYGANNPAR